MNRNQYARRVVLFVSVFCLLSATAHSQRAGAVKKIFATEFVFKGVVKNVDPNAESVTVSSESIPGPTIPGRLPPTNILMTYKVDNPEVLKTLKPGDRVTAKVLEGESKVLYDLQVAPPEDTPVFLPKK